MAKILIADSELNICTALSEALSSTNKVIICEKPTQLLSLLAEHRPQLLVVDLSMAGEDGLGQIKLAYMAGIRPKILASTRFVSDYVTDQLEQLEACYLLARPTTAELMLPRIVDILFALKENDARISIRRLANEMLLRLGFSMALQGYLYVLECIVYLCKRADCALTTELYPDVAKLRGGNARQVEHIVRTCINNAWQNRDDLVWRLYFPANKNGNVGHLSNGAFLKRIAFAVNEFYENYQNKASRTG